MTQIQRRIFAVLTRLGGEEVARLLTDYHGAQLLDEASAISLWTRGRWTAMPSSTMARRTRNE